MTVRQLIEELERMEKAYGSHTIVIAEIGTWTALIDGVIYDSRKIVLETR
jgi:hypothetical protein